MAREAYGAVVSVLTSLPSTRNSTRLTAPPASLAVAASGTAAPAAKCAPLVGLVRLTVGAVLPASAAAGGAVERERGRAWCCCRVDVPLKPSGEARRWRCCRSSQVAGAVTALAGLGPGGRPALLTLLAGVGEGEPERPAGHRVTGVGDGDVGGESALPVVGGVGDVAGDCGVGGGWVRRGRRRRAGRPRRRRLVAAGERRHRGFSLGRPGVRVRGARRRPARSGDRGSRPDPCRDPRALGIAQEIISWERFHSQVVSQIVPMGHDVAWPGC